MSSIIKTIIIYRIVSFIFSEIIFLESGWKYFFFAVVAKTRGGKRDDSRGGSTTSQRVHGWLLTVPVEN